MKKNELEILRNEIDQIDFDILKSLEKRNRISKRIGTLKKKNKHKINDNTREMMIISNLVEKSTLDKGFIKSIYLKIFKESRRVQK